MRTIRGKEAADFIEGRIASSHGAFAQFLAAREPRSAFDAWFEAWRGIEEFVNLPLFALNDEELEWRILRFRIGSSDLELQELAQIRERLLERLDEGVVRRYLRTVSQIAALCMAARLHRLPDVAGLRTIGDAVGYFQSRRRHLVALLYTLPGACRGSIRVERLDALNVFIPMLEMAAIPLTGLYLQRMLTEVFPDYELSVKANGDFFASHEYQTLDPLFLEAERLGVQDIYEARDAARMIGDLEPTDCRKIFTPAELRNNLRLLERGFAEFDLAGTEFGRVAGIAPLFLEHCIDHFRIEMPRQEFERIVGLASLPATMQRLLLHDETAGFIDNTNEFAPFIHLQGKCFSSVTLLTRFFNDMKSRCLEGVRRFQIHSGFVFEGSVKAKLAGQGFTIPDVKRIVRREFDVIALLDGVVFNVQCKNNRLDLTQFERYPARFARHNRRLDRYYAKALLMEESREHLLKARFNATEVRHVVVSRFPIATSNPRIISFAQLDEFKERFARHNPRC